MKEGTFPRVLEKEELKGMDYFQRGKYHFLIYNLDGSVGGRNSGLYLPPVNFLSKLDFFVFVKGKWLNLHRFFKRVKIDSFETTHYYEIGDLKINLEIFLPEDSSVVKFFIKASKNVRFKIKPVMEFGYVHKYHENPVKGYCFRKEKGNVIVSANFDEKTILMFNSDKKLEVEKKGLKIGSIGFCMKSGCVNVLCSEKSVGGLYKILKGMRKDGRLIKKKRYEKHIFSETVLKSDNEELNRSFEFAKHNVLVLRHRQPGIGRGFFAGVPDFLSFFGRDTFWSVPGILMLGYFENVRDCLNMFAKYHSEVSTETRKPGKIAHEIWLNGEPNYYSTDSSMLFISSLYWYYKQTLDREYLENIFPAFQETVDYLVGALEGGKINHGKLGFLKDTTWMDSYNRGGTAIEMQALVVFCLERAIDIAKITGNKKFVRKWGKERDRARKVLMRFIENGFCVDHINKDGTKSKSVTANPLFLLALNLVDKNKAKSIVDFSREKGLFTEYGVRSRAEKSQGYNPASYHKGGIWPFLSGIYLNGLFNYGLGDEGGILDAFSKYFSDFSYGFSPEYIHGNKFDLKSLKHNSCFLSLWSSSLFIQGVLEGLCGIKADKNGKLIVKPQLVDGVNEVEIKSYRFGDKIYNISIKGGRGKVRVVGVVK